MTARSGFYLSEAGVDWREAYRRQVAAAARPVAMPQAAE